MEMGWAGRCLEVGCMCVDICICKRAVYKGACLFLGFAIYVLAGGVGGWYPSTGQNGRWRKGLAFLEGPC